MIGRAILTTRTPTGESLVAGALNLWNAHSSSYVSFTTRWTTWRLQFLGYKGLQRPNRDLVRSQSHLLKCQSWTLRWGLRPLLNRPLACWLELHNFISLPCPQSTRVGCCQNSPTSYFELHLTTHSSTHFCMESLNAPLQSQVWKAATTYLLHSRDA